MPLLKTLLLACCLPIAACSRGIQSALDPAGKEASQIAALFWVMTIGGLIVWAMVVAVSIYAARGKTSVISDAGAGRLIFWGGVALPVFVLTALLSYALWLMPSLRPFAGNAPAALRIQVTGNQFWWRVIYNRPDGSAIVSANELRLPVGQHVEFELTSADMIHSFWIPALGGKMDMIPGRTNRLSLLATKAGTYRGQCAEFCGTSHARMAFPVIAMQRADFEAWLEARRGSTDAEKNVSGRALFERERCGRCHRVGNTPSQGTSGPDLSHVGSRLTIGAASLGNDLETLASFIVNPGSTKPGARMPAYPHLSADEATSMAKWLKGLK